MKVYAYFFISDSGDEYSTIVKSDSKPLTVHQAMETFKWDDVDKWKNEGYELEEIPYMTFIIETLDLDE